IYDRSMGLDGQGTAEAIAAIVGAMEETGAVLKHFPGYGGAADTHTGAAYDNRTYETFTESDFLPFRAGFEAGAQAVMVCHNVVSCMDPDRPASLSGEVHRILREELNFDGVAMTDDLAMGAVSGYTDEEAAVQAVKAGNDLLCSSAPATQYNALLSAVQAGEIPEARIDESVLRILRWKRSLGLLKSGTEEAD
ncbi:MAG: beta-hexosaminidase, partial [Oscillospiraceae bacterium]|nr:beta-hexosaminidase [Oscillospiraceae bacterium]